MEQPSRHIIREFACPTGATLTMLCSSTLRSSTERSECAAIGARSHAAAVKTKIHSLIVIAGELCAPVTDSSCGPLGRSCTFRHNAQGRELTNQKDVKPSLSSQVGAVQLLRQYSSLNHTSRPWPGGNHFGRSKTAG